MRKSKIQQNARPNTPPPTKAKHPDQQQPKEAWFLSCGGKTSVDPWFTGTLLRGLPVVFLATLVRATLFRHGTNDVNPVHVGQALPGAHPQCFLFGVRIDRFARGLTQ